MGEIVDGGGGFEHRRAEAGSAQEHSTDMQLAADRLERVILRIIELSVWDDYLTREEKAELRLLKDERDMLKLGLPTEVVSDVFRKLVDGVGEADPPPEHPWAS